MSGTQTLRDLVAAVEQVLIGKHAEAELADHRAGGRPGTC